MNKDNYKVNYILADDPSSFSLSPYDSDVISNLTIMEQVVGTLVKYTPSGKYEAFLVDKWTVSDNAKEYHFYFKSNIKDELGFPITPEKYIRVLEKTLKILAFNSKLPAFDQLIGWNEYISKENSIKGLSHTENKLTFKFKSSVENLIEYLAMPYYGYYNISNFDNDGNWIDNKKIISTGFYKVSKIQKNSITLNLRKSFYKKNSPNEVVIKNLDFSEAINLESENIIIQRKIDHDIYPSKFKLVRGTPTIMTSLVISPNIDNIFSDLENRKILVNKIIENQQKINFHSNSTIISNDFFINNPSEHDFSKSSHSQISEEKKILKVLITESLSKSEYSYVNKLLETSLNQLNIKFKIITEDRSEKNWIQKIQSNKYYDLRISRVALGSIVDNFILDLMFCTQLGVSFPDPTGKICQLTKENYDGKYSNKVFKNKFNEIYRQDVTVLPIFYSCLTWLFEDTINLKKVSNNMIIPRFDMLELE